MMLSMFKVPAAVVLVLAAGLAVGGLLHRTQAAGPMRVTTAHKPWTRRMRRKHGPHPPPRRPIQTMSQGRTRPIPLGALTCSEVVSVFDENEAAGDERFIGKRVRVTGKVDRVERFDDQHYLLTLRSEMKNPPKEGKPRGGYSPDTAPVNFLLPMTAASSWQNCKRGRR